MKFLIIAPRFHTNLYYRAKALQDAGHIVKAAVLYKGKSEFYENIDIQTIRLSVFSRLLSSIIKIFKKNYLKTAFELRMEMPGKELNKLFEEYKPDVLLLKAYQNMLAIKSLITAKKYRSKVLMLTQTPYAHIKGSKFLFQLNIKLFDFLKVYAYITPIQVNYNVFRDIGIKNVYYLPFVHPAKKIFNKTQNDEIKILSIGKFQKRKDQLLLLKVFKRLICENHKIKLCFIGELADENYFKEIKSFISENNLNKNVCLKTNLSYPETLTEYLRYDLFVLPAYNEPAAYSPVEAMANGLPVICSDDNGTQSYIENGKNGFIFKAKNKADLYEKIKKAIISPEKLQILQNNAIKMHQEHHLPELFAKNILQIVKN